MTGSENDVGVKTLFLSAKLISCVSSGYITVPHRLLEKKRAGASPPPP